MSELSEELALDIAQDIYTTLIDDLKIDVREIWQKSDYLHGLLKGMSNNNVRGFRVQSLARHIRNLQFYSYYLLKALDIANDESEVRCGIPEHINELRSNVMNDFRGHVILLKNYSAMALSNFHDSHMANDSIKSIHNDVRLISQTSIRIHGLVADAVFAFDNLFKSMP